LNLNNNIQYLRYLLWTYYLLLIFEGALRKWVLPGLATPLLVVRDPICIIALILGFPYLVRNRFFWYFSCIGIAGVILAIVIGHGDLIVALFGGRILLLHFSLIFLFPVVFDIRDLWAFAKVTLYITIPMTVLVGFQFYLPQSHFVNIGIGGEGSAGFAGALGRFRPPGTFSFTAGLSIYYALSASLLGAWFVGGTRPLPKLYWIGVACQIIALPLSVSRTLAFSYILIVLSILYTGINSAKSLGRVVFAFLVIAIIVVPLTQFPVFDDSIDAFMKRWETATENEGGDSGVVGVLEKRVIGNITGPLERIEEIPLFGYGIGLGTQTGAYLYFGIRGAVLGEGEWWRVTAELGFLLGILFMGTRIWLGIILGLNSLKKNRMGQPAPLILAPMALYFLTLGDTGVPTLLGFFVMQVGLWATSLKVNESDYPDQFGEKATQKGFLNG